jgi:hypothetical protein
MFRAIIAHHQELGTVCAAIRCVSCEVPSSIVYIAVMVLVIYTTLISHDVRSHEYKICLT